MRIPQSFYSAVLVFVFACILVVQANPLTIHFYGESTCGDCNRVKKELLKPLAAEKPDSLVLITHDILKENEFNSLLAKEEAYGITKGSPLTLFVQDTFLLGYDDIMNRGRDLILKRMRAQTPQTPTQSPTQDTKNLQERLAERSQSMSFWLITGAALADGVNPCAIATMIFLISFLATRRMPLKQTLLVGQTYIAAVFLTYLLMGLGAFGALTGLSEYHAVSAIIRWSAVALCTIVAVLSFRDAYAYAVSKDTANITLQLPEAVKNKIHAVIRGRITGRNLIIGAAVTGFLVTLLEAICTGQMYLPTIAMMTRVEGLRTQGLLYLVYYNLLFVLPLQIIMIASYRGMTWDRLAKKTQSNMVLLKVMLGLIMLFLALYLLIWG
ncbi:MAG: hypothetical protein ACQEQV_08075 [Fibrobacterota bacterium]